MGLDKNQEHNISFLKEDSGDGLNRQKELSKPEVQRVIEHLKSLLNLVKEGRIVNSFKGTGPEIVSLDTGAVMDPDIVNSLRQDTHISETTLTHFVCSRNFF